jgi:Protein of unknown function (DUF2889)
MMEKTAPQQFPLARNPIGPAPVRRPGSIRRTSSIDTSWPEGYGKPMLMQGTARDIWTPEGGGVPIVLAQDSYRIMASAAREILSIFVSPDRPHAQRLVGVRGGGQSRAALTEIMAEERIKGSPLYLILDDYAGASLVAGWVWSRWIDDWEAMAARSGLKSTAGRGGNMEGVCTGFSPGSSALLGGGGSRMKDQSCITVPPLLNPDDPDGWHSLATQEGVGMRRARRIDVWREGEELAIDVGFQDSGTQPDSADRIAIHEYHVQARTKDGRLAELNVDPRILPYRECPGAVIHTQRMLNAPLAELRAAVLATLPGILGCTHLNDVLRSMGEVPTMAANLPN